MDLLEIRKQNPWWESKTRILEDPKLRDYEAATVKWRPRLMNYLLLDKDAVYSVRGPRQVGKTTMVKLLIKDLLEQNTSINILYYACDLLKDSTDLNDLLETYHAWIRTQNQDRIYLFLDEISSVKEWQKAVKFFIDLHGNRSITMVVTGSHTLDIKMSAERLPGRVGEKEHISTHKILLPMKFAEYVELRDPTLYTQIRTVGLDTAKTRNEEFRTLLNGEIPSSAQNLLRLQPELDLIFDEYLLTGGIMVAVNEYLQHKRIDARIYDLYVRQLIGDMTRLKRDEKTAKLILAALLRRTCTPVSWNGVRKETGIAAQPTVDQYAHILSDMFVLNIFYQIEMDGKVKRASDKKIHILNPFIFHALQGWLVNPAQDPFESSQNFLANPENKSKLVEGVVGNHLGRAAYGIRPSDTFDPSDHIFYLKTKKGHEVDFMFKTDGLLSGVDVTYQNTLNPEDFRALAKLGRGCMISKREFSSRERISVVPVSIFLLYI